MLATHKIREITSARVQPDDSYSVWVKWIGLDDTYASWKDAKSVCQKYPRWQSRVNALIFELSNTFIRAVSTISHLAMSDLVSTIRMHPNLKASIQNVVSCSYMKEPEKMDLIQKIVKEKKAMDLPPRPPPVQQAPAKRPKRVDVVARKLLGSEGSEGTAVPLPTVMPPHGTVMEIALQIPRSFEEGDAVNLKLWDQCMSFDRFMTKDATPVPFDNKWYHGAKAGQVIKCTLKVYNNNTVLFRKGAELRTPINQEMIVTAGAWVTKDKRTCVHLQGCARKYHVTFPESVLPGDRYFFKPNAEGVLLIPPVAGEQGFKVIVDVLIPEGKKGGGYVAFEHTDGNKYNCRVPMDLVAGQRFQYQLTLKAPRNPPPPQPPPPLMASASATSAMEAASKIEKWTAALGTTCEKLKYLGNKYPMFRSRLSAAVGGSKSRAEQISAGKALLEEYSNIDLGTPQSDPAAKHPVVPVDSMESLAPLAGSEREDKKDEDDEEEEEEEVLETEIEPDEHLSNSNTGLAEGAEAAARGVDLDTNEAANVLGAMAENK